MTVYRRSPNLLVEWRGGDLVLVDCASLRRFRATLDLLDLLSRLDSWTPPDAIHSDDGPVEMSALERLVELALVERADGSDAANGSAGEAPLSTPYELAVHRLASSGGYRGDEELERQGAPPELRPVRGDGMARHLPRPEPHLDAYLDSVLEARRSVRSYADRPLPLKQLSTLLHHAARTTSARHDDKLGDEARHPYPTGGARSELEIYVVANHVKGLSAGAYRFDPVDHALTRLDADNAGRLALLRSVHAVTGGQLNRDPAVVLVITAVFARVMWKYRDLGLATIFKDTGCLMQTLYLVATAMGLAPCAVGGGDEMATTRWLGLDPLVEAQVGCFLVGAQKPPA
ncbi:MAG TPA: SagB family peptide dehydrogenase [Candidatus Dormibacteraeota bacterium]